MPRDGKRLPTATLAILAAAPVALGLAAETTLWPSGVGFPLDDSWIHLQFGRAMANGAGLAYNSGEPVLGTTAPLWSGLLALAHHLPGDPGFWALAFGVVAHLALVWLTYRCARDWSLPRSLAWLAAAWVATSGWLIWGALSGMEISLFALISLAALMRLDLEARHPEALPCAIPLLGLAVLLRPEALLLLALALFERAVRGHWGHILRSTLPLVLVLGPWVAFTWLSTGSPIPTTYAVKAGGGSSIHLPQLEYLRSVFWVLFQFQPIAPLLAGGGIAWLAARSRRIGGSWIAGAWLVGLPLALGAHSTVGGSPLVGNFGRYFFPLLPIVAILGAAALARLFATLGSRAAAAAACLLLLPGLTLIPKAIGVYALNISNVRDGDLAAATWLAPRLPADAVLAVNDIGLLKYLLPNHRVIDLVGISHPQVRIFGAQAQARGLPWWRGVLDYLEDQRPDYVVTFSSWLPQIAYVEGFVPVHQFTVANNITMGGDEIVVWSTPWTRAPLLGESMAGIELPWMSRAADPDQLEDHLQ